jgi:hypothetical protein
MSEPSESKMRKKILVKALNKNLEKMSKSPWVRSLKDGKDLICPFCEQLVQPCKSDPSAMCEQMLLNGTVGKEIEEALKDPVKKQYGVCLKCGKKISMAQLKKHPTTEICADCIKKCCKLKTGRSA